MSDVILNLANVMRTDIEAVNRIADNLSNVNTTGHRAEKVARTSQSFANLISSGANTGDLQSVFDIENGQLVQTGKYTDIGISGDAWFVLEGSSSLNFTRAGNFHVNDEGILVNPQGMKVLGDNGELDVGSQKFNVSDTGVITTSDNRILQMKLAKLGDVKSLQAQGNATYTGTFVDAVQPEFKVVQNTLEKSNVDSADEMVKLMESTRHIESLQRAMSTYDELLNAGINQIGNR